MLKRTSLPSGLAILGLGLLVSGCNVWEDRDLWLGAISAEAACPSCSTAAKAQYAQAYRESMNPNLAIDRRNNELAARRTNFSLPITLRCRYPNHPSVGQTWTEDVQVQNGEWYSGAAGNPNTAGNCNSAYLNNSGVQVEVSCSLGSGMIQHSTMTRASYGQTHAITTINVYSGRATMNASGSNIPSLEVVGQCEPLT